MNTPCVLVGTVFYRKQEIFSDESKGVFDKKAAESLIRRQTELSEETGLPAMVDVFAEKGEHMVERIEFVADACDTPFLIDSTNPDARILGLEYVDEVGLSDRAVVNSINAGIEEEEIAALLESDVSSAIVLGFNPVDNSVDGKRRLLEDGGGVLDEGLLAVAEKCGIKKTLIDTGITPLGEGCGDAVRAITVLKAKYGRPTGSGIHNAVSFWSWLKKKNAKSHVDSASNAVARIMGADFLLYGPIECADVVYPTVAFAECLVGEAVGALGLRVKKTHPVRRLVD